MTIEITDAHRRQIELIAAILEMDRQNVGLMVGTVNDEDAVLVVYKREHADGNCDVYPIARLLQPTDVLRNPSGEEAHPVGSDEDVLRSE